MWALQKQERELRRSERRAGLRPINLAEVVRDAIDLVRAEQNGEYNLLYDYMAPDSREMLPRQAFINWFVEQEFPVPTGVPEIESIS